MTQAQRREATSTALLDATIECLVDYGYANTTTARVADLAGVSRGAQLNYFRSKADLVSAALAHLAEKRIDEFRGLIAALPQDADRLPAILDALWDAHQGDVFDATLELWVAARTDEELRRGLPAVERRVMRRSLTAAAEAFPDRASQPEFRDDVEFALASIRGLALLRAASGGSPKTVQRHWPGVRERLLRVLA
jgi:AcrR family transcriptional regulator